MTLTNTRSLSISVVLAASACAGLIGCSGSQPPGNQTMAPPKRAFSAQESGVQFGPNRSASASREPDENIVPDPGDAADTQNLRPEVRAIRDRVLRQTQTYDAPSRQPTLAVGRDEVAAGATAAGDRRSLNSATIPDPEATPSRPPARTPPNDMGYGVARKAPSAHPLDGRTASPAAGHSLAADGAGPSNAGGTLNKDDGPIAGSTPGDLASTPDAQRKPAGPAVGPLAPAAPTPAAQVPVIRVGGAASTEDPAQASNGAKPPAVDVYSASEDLAHRLERRVRESPQDLAAQLDHQLLTFLKNEPAFSTPSAAALGREDRELLQSLINGIANFRAVLAADGTALMPRKSKPLLDMADQIRSQSFLNVPTVALCSKVSGFGMYEPLNPRFRAGVDQPVIIYCEVENFLSRMNDRQMYETRLSMEVTLFSADGSPIWSDKNNVPPDLSRNRRHDFFVIKHMVLPRSLALGRYLLKVEITDENAGRFAQGQMWVVMAAQ